MGRPVATYRVQISPEFGLHDTAGLAGYLATLGVTHLHASPLAQATPGSAHGYDVVDHSRVDTERGGEPGRQELLAALRRHGLGLVVDIVPNHCGVTVPAANPAWWDVLRLGRDSPYARWFDIDWSRGHVVLPVLGDEPDPRLVLDGDELRYGDLAFPVAPGRGEGTPREVHDRQHYRLVPASRANREVNYRRFFAVSGLAALRIEDPEVFEAVHELVLRWAADGECDGIRVDHPDGLLDPAGYLAALRNRTPEGTWVVVEKVLEPGEDLPSTWACAGTTGYDALREITGLFVDPAGAPAFTALDTELAGGHTDWPELVHSCKVAAATELLGPEVHRLAALAPEVEDAVAALTELLACLDVYRTYLPVGGERLDDAVAQAVRRRPDLAPAIGALHPRLADPADPLATRFQQSSGGVTAKGVEDTALYRWTRFTALNEVGGDPATFGRPVEAFHAACAERLARRPHGMVTLSTHDTKRGEDVRARLAVLAEVPDEWGRAVRAWRRFAPRVDGSFAHLVWQTAVGAWPIEPDRLRDYCVKAMREAARHTSWTRPDEAFEAAVLTCVDRVYGDPELRGEIEAMADLVRPPGWCNSLAQKLVALTMPGVPDVYQGCELWENSLVDPDNRRPVDFAARTALLDRLDRDGSPPAVDGSGAAKLFVTSRALRARRDRPEAFAGYQPLRAVGPAADHLVGYDRGGAVTLATRLPVGLARIGGWGETSVDLPSGHWQDVFTGHEHRGQVRLADALSRLPVALLTRERE